MGIGNLSLKVLSFNVHALVDAKATGSKTFCDELFQ